MGKLCEKFASFCLEAKQAKNILHHNRVEHVQERWIAAGESIKHFCIQLKEDISSCSRVKPEYVNISSHGDEVVEILEPEFREENQELAASLHSWTISSNSNSDISNQPEIDDKSESELNSNEFDEEESFTTPSDLSEHVGELTHSELLDFDSFAARTFANPEYISFDKVLSDSPFGQSASQIYGFEPPFFMTDCSKLQLNMQPNLGTEDTDIDQELQSGVLDMNAPISDSGKESEVSEDISMEEFRRTGTWMGSTSVSSHTHLANYEVELENASQSGETIQENAEDNEWERVVDEGFVDADWEIISEN